MKPKKHLGILLLPGLLLSSCADQPVATTGKGTAPTSGSKSAISSVVQKALEGAAVAVIVAGETAAVQKITEKLGPKVAKSGK